MRVGFVRKAGLGAVVLAAAALGACNDDPTSYDANDTTALFVNPTVMVLPAGRESKLISRAVNPGNEPTYADVTWAIDPTAGCVDAGQSVGTVSVIEDPDRLVEIQPPGLFVVTGGTTMGQTCIVLTSGGVSETVKVTVIADDILILDAPESILFGSTAQLSGQLVSNTDPPEVVSPPFDASQATWTSDDTDVATVDETGLVTGVGPGTATITACWEGTDATGTTGLGYKICDEVVIEVVVGDATVTGVTPSSGIPGQTVTINGSGFVSVHEVYIDGFSYGNPTVGSIIVEEVTPTSITIRWPNVGDGAHDVGVGIPGAVSAPVTFTQTASLEADEPANDDPGTTTTQIDVGEAWVGAFGTGEVDDWIIVEIAADGDYDFVLDWTGGSGDLDFLLYDGGLNNICFSYYSQPEADCVEQTLTAGTYYMLVEDFDAIVGNVTDTTYRLTVDATPSE